MALSSLTWLYSVYLVSAVILAIPGIIEAEGFDDGGQGVAYYDTDAGNSGDHVRDDTFFVRRPFGISTQVQDRSNALHWTWNKFVFDFRRRRSNYHLLTLSADMVSTRCTRREWTPTPRRCERGPAYTKRPGAVAWPSPRTVVGSIAS